MRRRGGGEKYLSFHVQINNKSIGEEYKSSKGNVVLLGSDRPSIEVDLHQSPDLWRGSRKNL